MIFLTGATGYLGRAFLASAARSGDRVRCLVLPDDPHPISSDRRVEVVGGDLAVPDGRLEDAGDGIRVVVHSAAVMPPARADRMHRVNVEGTRRMLDCARRWGVERFVYLSAVSATYVVRNAYGDSKRAAERLVRESGIPSVILRPTMVYGANGGLHFAKLVSLIRRIPLFVPIFGSGRQRLQPVALEDVVRALELACAHPAAIGGVYGASGATIVTFDELLDHVVAVLGLRRRKLHLPLPLCQALARVVGRLRPDGFFTPDALSGITQDASLDYREFERDCGYSPIELEAGLERALRSGRSPASPF